MGYAPARSRVVPLNSPWPERTCHTCEVSHFCESEVGGGFEKSALWIFAHLPVKLLLRSCSLVNTTWNREVRSFIRDHRICFRHRHLPSGAICEHLIKLDRFYRTITARGRLAPWNGLKISFRPQKDENNPRSTCCEKRSILNLQRDLNIKNLEITWVDYYGEEDNCEFRQPFQPLLRQCVPKLMSLTLRNSRGSSQD